MPWPALRGVPTVSTHPGDEPALAVVRAESGTTGWRAAARHQLRAQPDHADFYALAGETVSTLYALDDLFRVLRRQVARYAQGRPVYDDIDEMPAAERLLLASAEIDSTQTGLHAARVSANVFWSTIGHIGVRIQP